MEFRKMRRVGQDLSPEECAAILERNTSGVLALAGDNGYPYAVPLSYVYRDGKLWFHCSHEGHKADAIRADSRVSFCVVGQDVIVPEEYTTYYRSVILFGRARMLEQEDEIRQVLTLLTEKYSSSVSEEARRAYVEDGIAGVCIVEIDVEHMTGKEGLELAQSRRK